MNISVTNVDLPFLLPKTKDPVMIKRLRKMKRKTFEYCWEKRDVIAGSGHLFRLVKTGFIRNLNF